MLKAELHDGNGGHVGNVDNDGDIDNDVMQSLQDKSNLNCDRVYEEHKTTGSLAKLIVMLRFCDINVDNLQLANSTSSEGS